MLADLSTDDVPADPGLLCDRRRRRVVAHPGPAGHRVLGGRTYAERWIVIDTKVLEEWPGHDRLRFHCNPARPTVDCPTPLGHHRWEFPVRDDEDEQDLLQRGRDLEGAARAGHHRENVKILRASPATATTSAFADRWRVGRVFLAGDAAHAMPPWIGQGMCAGVRDVANLCWKLAAVLERQLPESVLDSYQAERNPHVKEVTNRAVKTGKLIIRAQPLVARRCATTSSAPLAVPGASSPGCANTAVDSRRPLPRRLRRQTATAPSAG